MSCTILQVRQRTVAPIHVYKLVKWRLLNGALVMGPEYEPIQRSAIPGYMDPHGPDFFGEMVEYNIDEITKSPSGPGIMVYTDPPTSLSLTIGTAEVDGYQWLLCEVPADTGYFIGFHEGKKILCVGAIRPIAKLVT